MWTMLLDRAQRQEHDHARIAGELRCSWRRQLGEPNHCNDVREAGLDRGWPDTGATRLRTPDLRWRSEAAPGVIR